MLKKIIKFISKISVRLLLFNVLLVFLPAAFLFYLDTYEKKLLNAQEHAMVQQGRIMSSALEDKGDDFKTEAVNILENLKMRQEARIRIITSDGIIVADSSIPDDRLIKEVPVSSREYRADKTIEKWRSNDKNFLYSLIRTTLDFLRYFLRGPRADFNSIEYYSYKNVLEGTEIQAALEGRYGATTRISRGGQRSITMYSAIPVFNNSKVYGVVLVSQSTFRILQNLYQIRLEIFKIFLISLSAAGLISFILSRTIAHPLKKLRNQAKEITDNRGRIKTNFKKPRRLDEIGDLNHSLHELTQKLHNHLLQTESFASDVSHELKNPLSSIQSASEILSDRISDKQNMKFINIISQETSRLERLITEVRDISTIDVKISEEDTCLIDPEVIIKSVITNTRLKLKNKNINFCLINNSNESTELLISPGRFTQVVENIISNAVSFSPDGGSIKIILENIDKNVAISICDQGPGIPDENMDRIFNRFFTYRNSNNNGKRNSGLGLSICEVIVKAYGGSITAENRENNGAVFKIKLPSPVLS